MKKSIISNVTRRSTSILLAAFMAFWQLAAPLTVSAIVANVPSVPVSTGNVTPFIIDGSNEGGNRTCAEVGTAFYGDSEYYEKESTRFDSGNQYSGTAGPITWSTTDSTYVSWSGVNDGLAVIVKGSSDANVYTYNGTFTSDGGLASPPAGQSGTPATLSNITFCWNEKDEPETGKITIIKNAKPNHKKNFSFNIEKVGGGLDEDFVLDDDGDNANKHSNSKLKDNLVAGSYVVTESVAKGWKLKKIDCTGGKDIDKDVANRKVTINLSAGEEVTCKFVNVKDKDEPKLGKIKGFKFNDLNGNGILNPNKGETKLSGWTIFLDEDKDGKLGQGEKSTVTDADGHYSFEDLPAGEYRVCEVQQIGWEQTWPVANNGCHVIDLDAGEIRIKVKFGNREKKDDQQPRTGTITVIKDAQPNDAQDFHFTLKKATQCNQTVSFAFLATATCYNPLKDFYLDDDNDADLQDSELTHSLTPGEYLITEDAEDGWSLDDITCNAEVWKRDGNSVKVELFGDENIVCTFTNVKDEVPEVPVVPQVLSAVTDEKEQPQVLAVTGESYDWRGSAMAVTLAGAALVTVVTRRKEEV